jgi:hypothetical protein
MVSTKSIHGKPAGRWQDHAGLHDSGGARADNPGARRGTSSLRRGGPFSDRDWLRAQSDAKSRAQLAELDALRTRRMRFRPPGHMIALRKPQKLGGRWGPLVVGLMSDATSAVFAKWIDQ